MQRLVTEQDLKDHPELINMGVSINQYWEFPEETVETAPPLATPEPEAKKAAPKKNAKPAAKTAAPKKDTAKKKAKK